LTEDFHCFLTVLIRSRVAMVGPYAWFLGHPSSSKMNKRAPVYWSRRRTVSVVF
jgi:hypothetical protein